jgi:O-antigen ligase
MKTLLLIVASLVLVVGGVDVVLFAWAAASPFVDNFIARPQMSPFFGSYLLVGESSYGVSGFSLRELLGFSRIVLLAVAGYAVLKRGNTRVLVKAVDYPFIAFLVALAFAATYSFNLVHRARVVLDTYFSCYLAYFIGKNLFSDTRRRKTLSNAILCLGAVLVVVCIAEYFVNSAISPLYRVTGPFLYWENLGLTLSIVFFVARFRKDCSAPERTSSGAAYSLLLALVAIVVALAQTRTIMIVLLVGLGVYMVLVRRWLGARKVRRFAVLMVLGTVVLVAFPAILTSTQFYQHRLSARTDEDRIESYTAAVRMFARNPMFGVGLKDFSEEKKNYVSEYEVKWGLSGYCHNSYLVVAAETGLLGLVPMILLVTGAFRTCLRYYRVAKERGRQEALWGAMMIVVTLVYFLSAMTFDVFFEATIDNKLYFMLLGITACRLGPFDGSASEPAS